MSFSFHPEAEEEFLAAIDYHEERENGLGLDFSVEIYAAIQLIVAHPNAWPVLEEDVRRCLVNRFPYGILYAIDLEEIVILAVMHQRRRPDYWKDRAGS
ncbi:MAG: type II toxin-antitoxin system RelE/ParE family toxin [Burkholderiales bacterium]